MKYNEVYIYINDYPFQMFKCYSLTNELFTVNSSQFLFNSSITTDFSKSILSSYIISNMFHTR